MIRATNQGYLLPKARVRPADRIVAVLLGLWHVVTIGKMSLSVAHDFREPLIVGLVIIWALMGQILVNGMYRSERWAFGVCLKAGGVFAIPFLTLSMFGTFDPPTNVWYGCAALFATVCSAFRLMLHKD